MSGITWPAPVSSVGGTHPWLCRYRVAGLYLFPLAVGGGTRRARGCGLGWLFRQSSLIVCG